MSGVLNYFQNEERSRNVFRARCSWCGQTSDTVNRLSRKSKDFYDCNVEVAGLTDKGRVCSTECGAAWRDWAREKLRKLNASFPVMQ